MAAVGSRTSEAQEEKDLGLLVPMETHRELLPGTSGSICPVASLVTHLSPVFPLVGGISSRIFPSGGRSATAAPIVSILQVWSL